MTSYSFSGFGSDSLSGIEPVGTLLAGPVTRITPWMNLLMTDGRFRVTAMSTDAGDLNAKLSAKPEVLLLDASILEGEAQLIELLTRLQCAAYVVTPYPGGPDLPGRLGQIDSVKGAYYLDVNLAELIGKIYSDALALRGKNTGGLQGVWGASQRQAGSPTGLRIITVWNQMGGVGKTTIATNLAYESARRSFPTLLIGLGAPDDLPLVAGLKPEPNITQWWSNPTPEGIKLAVQKLDTLDVLAGFPDVLSETQAAFAPPEALNSIPRLITTAAHYLGYAVIFIDAPPSALAASAISASNSLILVARPSLEGILRTVEAYRTVVERLAGEHRIPAENIFLVLNRMGGRLSADEWHRAASQALGRSFLPVLAQIPDNPEIGMAHDKRRLPLLTSDEFNRGLRPLADAILRLPQQIPGSVAYPAAGKKVLHFGPIKVRL
jgi:cellulose biosynthesis protein BcsQ